MEKVPTFFKGDPANTKLFGNELTKMPKVITSEQKKKWLMRRDEARKNPPPFALVQNPKTYDDFELFEDDD